MATIADPRAYSESLWQAHAASLDLSGKTMFLTGATGFFGSWTLDLLAYLHRHGRGPRVLALSRNPQTFLARRPDYAGQSWLQWLAADIADYRFPEQRFDYVIHAAHISPQAAPATPLTIFDATVTAARHVLDHAVARHCGRLLLVSTGAVGRAAAPDCATDWHGSNAAYCEAKRTSETLAALYRASRGLAVVVARPFSFVGPGLPLDGTFAIGNFIRDALWRDEISVQSDGTPVRTYLYAADLAIWILKILIDGIDGRTYNIGSDSALDLREAAKQVGRQLCPDKHVHILGVPPQMPGASPADRYVPDIAAARGELGLDVWTDFVTAVALTANAAAVDSASLVASQTGPTTGGQNNPHFDDDRVIWRDAYSGLYQPTDYSSQFDDQWRLYLENKEGFRNHSGVDTSDPYIDDRIFELTGVAGYLAGNRQPGAAKPYGSDRHIGGRLFLEPRFPVDFFAGKRCLDLGCGAGRWTRTMQAMGATVKSADVSPHALVEALDLFRIAGERPDLHGAFDFVLCWGVIMCTHDPLEAFANVAKTVRPGGHLYIMVYAPTYHNSEFVRHARLKYHRELVSSDDKLNYAYELADTPGNAINILDMLNTFYNWTIPEETVHDWFRRHGFTDTVTLNAREADKCAYHVLGRLPSGDSGI
jgi:nucleoside-diphosphate-sugar epimerase/SAM-dependent methyltransferase